MVSTRISTFLFSYLRRGNKLVLLSLTIVTLYITLVAIAVPGSTNKSTKDAVNVSEGEEGHE